MSWVCLKEGRLYIIGVRSAFGSYKRDVCDITATRRSYDKLASESQKNENRDQKLESIVHGSKKKGI